MPKYRGPATITKVMTPTTYTLQHKGRTYQRCLSELRPYRASNDPDLNVGVAPDTSTSFEVGAFIAYRDTDDPADDNSSRYHIGKVLNVADGQAHVHCYATHGKALSRAQWAPLFQNHKGAYATGDDSHGESVVDLIPVDEQEWMLHYNIELNPKGRLTKRCRKQLADKHVQHHRLGHSFP